MPRRALLLLALFLTACAAAPVVEQIPVGMDPESAGRLVSAATYQAGQAATAQAASTAVRVATQQAIADVLTVAAVTQAADSTHAAQTPTAAAAAFSLAATQDAATVQARTTQAAYTITQAAVMTTAQRRALESDRDLWIGTGARGLAALVLLFGLAGILYQIERIMAAAATEREAHAGRVAIVLLASGLSYDVRRQALIDAPAYDPELVEASPRTYATHDADGAERTVEMPVSDAEKLLVAAVRAGYGAANRIPSAAQIGWPGERRGAAVKSLGGAVETHYGSPANGGGTYIHARWGSVAALLGAIQAGQVIPTAPPPQPEPVREGAKVSA